VRLVRSGADGRAGEPELLLSFPNTGSQPAVGVDAVVIALMLAISRASGSALGIDRTCAAAMRDVRGSGEYQVPVEVGRLLLAQRSTLRILSCEGRYVRMVCVAPRQRSAARLG
jgi:hypothetical protein